MFLLRRYRSSFLWGPLLAVWPFGLTAQQGPAGAQPARVQQVPLSGRQSQQSGDVSVQQTTAPGGAINSSSNLNVDVSTTNVQVQGSYLGSVPSSTTALSAVTITIEQALRLGLQYNLGAVSSSASLRYVRGQRLAAFSALLPTVNAIASETGAKSDLQTLGLVAGAFGPVSLPTTVGPFHYYDARAAVNFNAFDLTALHNFRSAKEVERAAEMSDQDARELVVLGVGGEYLKVLADVALVEAQVAQVRYAQSSYDQTYAQTQAGTRAAVDAKRSQVQLQTEQQRLTAQRADLVKEKRTLARMIGLHLESEITPAEKLVFATGGPSSLDDALKQAMASRADLKSAAAQLRAAEETLKAAHGERMPLLNLNGYVAVQGINPDRGAGVFSGTASVTIPVFQGGRIEADEQQAHATIDQRRAEYQDQRGVVELDVRNAFTDLETATNQVQVAQSNRTLALETLQQTQDQYLAGVATSVDVVQSQQGLASAEQDYVSSLYSYNLARISLARATGQAEASIPQFLKGQ